MTSGHDDDPSFVTFETGAALLNQRGIATGMTGDGVRYLARTRPDWPFGEDREHSYVQVGNARVMATDPFLAYFRTHPPAGRGPDKQPRRRRGEAR